MKIIWKDRNERSVLLDFEPTIGPIWVRVGAFTYLSTTDYPKGSNEIGLTAAHWLPNRIYGAFLRKKVELGSYCEKKQINIFGTQKPLKNRINLYTKQKTDPNPTKTPLFRYNAENPLANQTKRL